MLLVRHSKLAAWVSSSTWRIILVGRIHRQIQFFGPFFFSSGFECHAPSGKELRSFADVFDCGFCSEEEVRARAARALFLVGCLVISTAPQGQAKRDVKTYH